MSGGELLQLSIYIFQQAGIMLGIGAQTVILCTHLLVLHRHESESTEVTLESAARTTLWISFALIILSGLGAVALHWQAVQLEILLAPAFLFKWILILVLLFALALESTLGHWNDAARGFVGATWYALFVIHTLGLASSWLTLGILYAVWLVFFGLVWSVFVWMLRRHNGGVIPEIKKEVPKPVPPPKPLPPPPPIPKPIPPPPPSPPPKPIPPPAPLPMVIPPPPPPKPVPPPAPVVPPPPALPAVALAKEGPKPLVPQPIIATTPAPTTTEPVHNPDVPALRIMPQKPEDIGNATRPQVVKS